MYTTYTENIIIDFEVRKLPDGTEVYSCKACAQWRGQHKWFKTKPNTTKHLESSEHLKVAELVRGQQLHQQTLQYERDQESMIQNAFNKEVPFPLPTAAS